jgi:hypothetical protein
VHVVGAPESAGTDAEKGVPGIPVIDDPSRRRAESLQTGRPVDVGIGHPVPFGYGQ